MAAEDFMSACGFEVEYSTDFAAWTVVDSFFGILTPSQQTRASGEFHVFGADVPRLTMGARSSVTIDSTFLFTNAAADPFTIMRAQHTTDCAAPLYLRWSPAGGAVGDLQFTTTEDQSWISAWQDPAGDKSDAAPITVQFQVITADVAAALVV
jgi:hypothetical protein